MASVNELIVREFFESLGFLVNQPRKYQVMSRAKQAEEEVDFIVLNPHASGGELPAMEVWGVTELRHVPRAVVGIRGWHTKKFSPAELELEREMFRLADSLVIQKADKLLSGSGAVAKIICLPDLPAAGAQRRKSLDMLKAGGIDGVLLFRPMLADLIRRVDVQKNYERSDLLQMLRILKAHDLLKDAQLDLFHLRRRQKKVNRQGAEDAKSNEEEQNAATGAEGTS